MRLIRFTLLFPSLSLLRPVAARVRYLFRVLRRNGGLPVGLF